MLKQIIKESAKVLFTVLVVLMLVALIAILILHPPFLIGTILGVTLFTVGAVLHDAIWGD